MFMISFYIVYIEQNHQRFMVNQRNSPCFFRTPIGSLASHTPGTGKTAVVSHILPEAQGDFTATNQGEKTIWDIGGKSWPWNFPYANHGAGIFTYKTGWFFRANVGANVGKYSIHGAYGFGGIPEKPYLYRKPPSGPRLSQKFAERMMLDEFWMNLKWPDQIHWAYRAAILGPKISH